MSLKEDTTQTPLKSRIWKSDGMNYQFPEQQLSEITSRPSIAICLSGGGDRAMTAAMGQLRALNDLGIIEKAQYLSCVSGGSWAGTIFTYYEKGFNNGEGPKDDTELLRPIKKTNEITPTYLSNSLNKKNLAYAANTDLIDALAWASHKNNFWVFAVGSIFLYDFGLFDKKDASYHIVEGHQDLKNLPYFTYNDKTEATIKHANPQLNGKKFHKVNEGRPFLVVNSSIPNPQADAETDGYVSFEYTPLTIGRPYANQMKGQTYGGGFIEPFAFRGNRGSAISPQSDTPIDGITSTGCVHVSGQDRPQTLADATGTSSAFFAQVVAHGHLSQYVDPKADYWPIDNNGPFSGTETLFADGGLLDNYGLISMIQRGVEMAIVFINTETPLNLDFNPGDNPKGHCDSNLPGLFGYANSDWGEYYYYPNNQVFPQEEFGTLLDKLKERKQNHEPLIVLQEHTIIGNDHWGVKPRTKKMKVVWCYLDRVQNWEDKLNSDVKYMLNKNSFPNYPTVSDLPWLSKEEIVFLSDFTCNIILEDNKQVIQQAVDGMR